MRLHADRPYPGTRGTRFARLGVSCAVLAACGAAVVMGAEGDASSSHVAPSARLAVVAPPATQTSTDGAPSAKRAWLPARSVPVAARPAAVGATSKDPMQPAEKPPLISSDATPPPPGRPQFAQGPRRLVTPAPALAPRIPNLLVTPRKYAQQASPNSGASPAAAITTPPVNNIKGTAVLPTLAPFTRDIAVEIAPPTAPLAFDREPYVQAPEAPDDEDAPVPAPDGPAKPPVE